MTSPTRRPGRPDTLHKARARAAANPVDSSWPLRLAEDLHGIRADWKESAVVCADAAWTARAAGV
ncbi:hypothetical protein OG596_09510 [Streptomyces sp. NBC_01102]|uniref:hypothetical protein n=1 Tax=Streptomyces sp. NBC_01102 TaxID=2903749 RepID=UPI00386E0B89|nr:hypothetical protein OG596_09510 [Streptomyces sp. NBC_01102]